MRTMRIEALGRPLVLAEVPRAGARSGRGAAAGPRLRPQLRRHADGGRPLPGEAGAALRAGPRGLRHRRGARPRRRRPGRGTRVAGLCGAGGLAEFVALPGGGLRPGARRRWTTTAAAGFLVAYGTSHVALALLARLRPGETLLVTGASGGVGLTAVELGALIGARVVAVARGAAKRAVAADGRRRRSRSTPTTTSPPRSRRSAAPTSSTTPSAARCSTPACARRSPARGCCRSASPAARCRRSPANRLLVKNQTVIGFYFGAWVRAHPAAARASLETLFAWHAARPAHGRTSATCCRSRRRTPGSSCCGPAAPPARSWCGSPELLGGDPLGAAVGLAHAARQPVGQRRPRPVADVHVDQVVGQLGQRPAVADQLAARRDRARRAARRSRGRR